MDQTDIITSVPAAEPTADIARPEFTYPELFHGVQLSTSMFGWLREHLPRERTDQKPLTGVGVAIYKPGANHWRDPWMTFAFDAEFNWVDPMSFTGANEEQMLYVLNAMRKMKFTMRTGLPSSAALVTHRHLRESGDFCYDGAIIHNDIPVSISGYTKEMDAEQSLRVAAQLAAFMGEVIDDIELRSSSQFWRTSQSKEDLLEMFRSGVAPLRIGLPHDRTSHH
jgi:hypothetical protein